MAHRLFQVPAVVKRIHQVAHAADINTVPVIASQYALSGVYRCLPAPDRKMGIEGPAWLQYSESLIVTHQQFCVQRCLVCNVKSDMVYPVNMDNL
ncbi:hypothetical protein GCM10009415_37920 [Chitinophaga japonensis]